MPGVIALEKTLIGVEALAGSSTDVVTTTWRGVGKVKDRREIVFPPERVGKIGGTTRSYTAKTGAEVLLESDATFQQLCYIKNAGIYLATPTTDTSSAQIRTWTVQHSSSDALATTDLATLVVESGDNNGIRISRYCVVREYSETWKQGEAMQVSAILFGQDPSTSATFTTVGDTDLDNPAQSIIGKTYLYIDPSTDTIGTTAKSETVLETSLKHTTGWVPLPAKDGRLDYSNVKHIDDEIMLDVTFEHNSVASTEYTAFKNQTERALRVKWIGNALTTTDAGATYDTFTYIVDLWGKWQTFGAEGPEEIDGDNVYKGTFKVAFSAAALSKARFIVANESATLP